MLYYLLGLVLRKCEVAECIKLDAFGRKTAVGIAKKLQEFNFFVVWLPGTQVLFKINMVSKVCQNITVNLQNSTGLIQSVQELFRV